MRETKNWIRLFQMNKTRYLIGWGVVVILSWTLYFSTMARDITGIGDSDELLATGYSLGLSHSPGYPLFTGLVWLVTNLPLPGLVAVKGHLLAVLFEGLSVGWLYLISREIWIKAKRNLHNRDQVEMWEDVALVLGSVLVSTNLLIWRYGSLLEVFGLNNFLVLAVIWMSIRRVKVVWIGAMMGLMLAHHHLSWLIIPGLIIWNWENDIKLVKLKEGLKLDLVSLRQRLIINRLGILAGLITWLGSNLVLFWFNQRLAEVSWNFEADWRGWWQYVWRGVYAGRLADGSIADGAYWTGFAWLNNWTGIIRYFTDLLPQHFGFIAVMVLVMAIYWGWHQLPKKLWISLIVMAFCSGPMVSWYLIDPNINAEAMMLSERMLVMGYFIWSWWIPVGCAVVMRMVNWLGKIILEKYGLEKRFSGLLVAIVMVGMVSLIGMMIWQHFPQVDMRKYEVIGQMSRRSLESMPENAVVVCFSDVSCFSLLSLQTIESKRKDIIIVPVAEQFRSKHLQGKSELWQIGFKENPWRITEVIAQALATNRAVYVTEPSKNYLSLLGLDGTMFSLNGNRYLSKVECGSESKNKLNFGVDQSNLAEVNNSTGTQSFREWHQQIIGETWDHPVPECWNAEAAINKYNECGDVECQLTWLLRSWLVGSKQVHHLWFQSQQ